MNSTYRRLSTPWKRYAQGYHAVFLLYVECAVLAFAAGPLLRLIACCLSLFLPATLCDGYVSGNVFEGVLNRTFICF